MMKVVMRTALAGHTGQAIAAGPALGQERVAGVGELC